MALIANGDASSSPQTAAVGAFAASGLHVIPKPQDYSVSGNPTYGHYQTTVATGAIGAGSSSDSEILQFRWTDVTRVCLIQRVWLTGMRATTAFVAGAIDIKLTRATAWTVAGTGGTTVTLTDPEMQLRPAQMGPTLVSEIRIATTAALGAGTKTLDTGNFNQIVTHSSAGWNGATPIIGSIYLPVVDLFDDRGAHAGHPLTLAQNEGFVVRVTVPGTGVWNLGLAIRWAEVDKF